MPTATKPPPDDAIWRDSPTAWFAVLQTALAEGDLNRAAAAAQRELERLGVTVVFRRTGRMEVQR